MLVSVGQITWKFDMCFDFAALADLPLMTSLIRQSGDKSAWNGRWIGGILADQCFAGNSLTKSTPYR